MQEKELETLVAERWRMALTLTGVMLAIYLGFVLLVAYTKELMGSQIVPGLSFGILLGALVIVYDWVLNGIYTRWANTYYDEKVRQILRR